MVQVIKSTLRSYQAGSVVRDDEIFARTGAILDATMLDSQALHEGRITLALTGQAGHSCVTVTDSGPGIPEQERDNVLRRFYRLEASRGLPGNGLGLSLRRRGKAARRQAQDAGQRPRAQGRDGIHKSGRIDSRQTFKLEGEGHWPTPL